MEPNTVLGTVYTCFILLLDVVSLIVKTLFTTLCALYQEFVPPEEKSVSGDIVLITGTGHGIGKELAKQYGSLGAVVVCVDLNAVSNEETVKQLKNTGIKAFAYSCDVSKRDEIINLGNRIRTEVGEVSILVNNAGIMPCKKFMDHTAEDITKIFNINVLAHFWLIQQFLPKMIERNYGHIVGISSMVGLIGIPNVSPYSASKFAVRGLMESLCEELRQEGRNINFTTIFPYIVDTGLCKKPKVRFASVLPIQTPQTVASEIIKAQRRNYREHTVPGFMNMLNRVMRLHPEKTQTQIIDFAGSGVEASD